MVKNALDLARQRSGDISSGYSSRNGYMDSKGNTVVSSDEILKNAKEARKKLMQKIKQQENTKHESIKQTFSPIPNSYSFKGLHQIPDNYKSTSSNEYGYVDSSGKQIASVNQIRQSEAKNKLAELQKR